ncbi:MAG: hypothetical protein RR975_01820 [Clostridia bacterium]
MKNTLSEIRNAVMNPRMLACLMLGLALLYQPEFYLRQMQSSFGEMDLYNAMQTSLGLGAYVMLATVLCAIPYAERYCWENKTRYQLYAQYRQGKCSYIAGKTCATAISGGIAISAPFMIFCLIQLCIAPQEEMTSDLMFIVLQEIGLFFMYGSAWSTLALGASTFTSSPLVVLAFPICIERGAQLLAVAFQCDWLRLSDAIAYQCGSVYSIKQIAFVDGFLLLTGVLLFVIRMVIKENES